MEINGIKIEKGAILTGFDLEAAQLVKVDLSEANLDRANLKNAWLFLR